MRTMKTPAIALLLALPLAGCGLADTATTAAVSGGTKAEEAKDAQNTVKRAEEKVDAAMQVEAERLKAQEQTIQTEQGATPQTGEGGSQD